ncbi:MAG: tetratricopeptide repeat protein [Planctomycetes bacterium]|nr:tetratricopeptide repeat protein [Planctomycetota bacterium]
MTRTPAEPGRRTGSREATPAPDRGATVRRTPRYDREPVVRRPATDAATGTRTGATRVTPSTRPADSRRGSAVLRTRDGATRPTTAGATATATPRLVPRTGAPLLTTSRARSSLVAGVTAPAAPRSSWSHSRGWSDCHPTLWNSWWQPRHYHGCSTWNWFWTPWYCYRTRWWDDCYSYSWNRRWYHPHCASTTYWWYPTTTYCPVYLTVPGSVVVVQEAPAPAEPAEPAAVDGGVIVAGGPARPLAPAERALPADDLAAKYAELARFYFEAGRFADAAEAYGRARSYSPDDGALHFECADAAFANGDYHYAAFLIAEALRLDPKLAGATVDKREFYGDTALFDRQMEDLDRYLAGKPFDAAAHLVRGYNLRFTGDAAAAEAAFRRVLEITPEHRAAQTFLAALAAAPAPAAPAEPAEPSMR